MYRIAERVRERRGFWIKSFTSRSEMLAAVQRGVQVINQAFSSFGPSEKRNVCEILGEIWGVGGEEASDILNRELEEEEQKVLEDINEFDFGDI